MFKKKICIKEHFENWRDESCLFEDKTPMVWNLKTLLNLAISHKNNTFPNDGMLSLINTCHSMVSSYKIDYVPYIAHKFGFYKISNQMELIQELYALSQTCVYGGQEDIYVEGCIYCFIDILNTYDSHLSNIQLQQIKNSLEWILVDVRKMKIVEHFKEIIA